MPRPTPLPPGCIGIYVTYNSTDVGNQCEICDLSRTPISGPYYDSGTSRIIWDVSSVTMPATILICYNGLFYEYTVDGIYQSDLYYPELANITPISTPYMDIVKLDGEDVEIHDSRIEDPSIYLTSHQDISGKEDRVAIETSLPSGALSVNTYYALSTALTGAVTVTLPTISDVTHGHTIAMSFSTDIGFTTLTIVPPGEVTVSYYKDYEIEASSEYEINMFFNGTKWIVSYAVIE